MILVTGATGATGGQVVRALSALGAPVRALVRNPAKAAAIAGPGVEIVIGDLERPETLDRALRGVRRMFLVSSGDLRMADLQGNAVAAARRAGVRHVVKLSAVGAGPDSPVQLLRLHARIEEDIRHSGLAWTMLQPNFFMQNFLQFAPAIAAQGAFHAPAGDGKSSVVDVRDIAAVAVAVLTGANHAGKTYVVTGAEPLSYADAAAKIGTAIGRPVAYVNVPPEAARKSLLERGMPGWLADDLVALAAFYGSGQTAAVTPVVDQTTGRAPRRFDQFARELAGTFRGAGVRV